MVRHLLMRQNPSTLWHGQHVTDRWAHNANATAKVAWKVMPELMVQHAIICVLFGGSRNEERLDCSSPPSSDCSSCFLISKLTALRSALRTFFSDYKIRAQMNTKYMETSTREVTVTHVMNLLISKLTSADIQSTITPDEGRNVPWHMYHIEACDTGQASPHGMDGLKELVNASQGRIYKDKETAGT
jgi:D-ornithine 4,5-aminomutase subunit beta